MTWNLNIDTAAVILLIRAPRESALSNKVESCKSYGFCSFSKLPVSTPFTPTPLVQLFQASVIYMDYILPFCTPFFNFLVKFSFTVILVKVYSWICKISPVGFVRKDQASSYSRVCILNSFILGLNPCSLLLELSILISNLLTSNNFRILVVWLHWKYYIIITQYIGFLD